MVEFYCLDCKQRLYSGHVAIIRNNGLICKECSDKHKECAFCRKTEEKNGAMCSCGAVREWFCYDCTGMIWSIRDSSRDNVTLRCNTCYQQEIHCEICEENMEECVCEFREVILKSESDDE